MLMRFKLEIKQTWLAKSVLKCMAIDIYVAIQRLSMVTSSQCNNVTPLITLINKCKSPNMNAFSIFSNKADINCKILLFAIYISRLAAFYVV